MDESEKDELIAALQDELKECYFRKNELRERLNFAIFEYDIKIIDNVGNATILHIANNVGQTEVTITTDKETMTAPLLKDGETLEIKLT